MWNRNVVHVQCLLHLYAHSTLIVSVPGHAYMLHDLTEEEDSRRPIKVRCVGVHSLRGTLNQRGLNPIKLVYKPSRPDGWLFTAQCTLVQMRGLGIACRLSVCPSVCPSVTLVICDHIGWKSWKLTARTISPTHSLFVARRRSTYSQGNMGKFWGD